MRIVDHTPELKQAERRQTAIGLEAIGLTAEGYAKLLCPVDTGILRNSITHAVKEQDKTVVLSTNVSYAPYVEYGTGVFAENDNGRQTPWRYQDAKGNWHTTTGQKPQPFIRPAVNNHLNEYQQILEQYLRG